MTLPTYDKLLDQIDDMRKEEWDEDKSKKLHNQKINNISILGARGTGKTSILKSLINKLEEENIEENKCKKDIILGKNVVLPMIVPENMSTSSNLMSMILGLFKGIVDKLEKKYDNKTRDCWFEKKSNISTQYLELVKKFCFIQPDFKSVPIKQYTTENDYVEKSSQIYQSDIEFMACFNEFINKLMTIKEDEEEKEEKNKRLIFVFIDDMDLSTQRCVDAVRTLLAYISHPRIVTVLAGDLETFEEALTLDFIRQEQMLRADILETNFVVANGEKVKYLERKKELTYEYLKKVMPVIYRHNLREWSLETRGNYIVKGNVGNAKSLVELLNACFSTLENPPIFQYFENEEGEGKNLPQMFHIFDHTARGLNAVYNVLLDTHYIMQNGEEDKKFPQIKILLETIVGSNSLFNQYRKQIFEDIIKFGVDFEGTKIDCENFESFIEKEFPKNEQNKPEEQEKTEELKETKYKINSIKTKKRFRFFVLLDFSIRVLEKNEILDDKTYLELKRDNMIKLINNPVISESMASSKDIVKSGEGNEIILCTNLKNEDAQIMSDIILKFLSSSDFSFALTLYNFLSYKRFDFFEDGKENDVDWSWMYELCCSIYNELKSISRFKMGKEKEIDREAQIRITLASFTTLFKEEFRNLIGLIGGGNPVSQMLKMLLNGISSELDYRVFLGWKEKKYRNILLNILSNILERRIFDKNFLIPLNEKGDEYKKLFATDEYKNMYDRLSIILSIDKNDLWKDNYSKVVRKYVKGRLIYFIEHSKFKENEMVDVSCIEADWIVFKRIYKGVSNTIARQLESFINGLFTSNGYLKIKLSDLKGLFDQLTRLAYSGAWYGRAEAFTILKALENAKLDSSHESNLEEESSILLEYLYVFIHIYASYTLAENNDLYLLSANVSEFINYIYDGFNVGVNNQIESYKAILTKDVGKETVSKFEELFS
ncbi:MAG: P-loop NTPase fold protein [Peptoanaerobacter stomatis]|uniref:P-loop NTPase fold protein n=1 Tax=Peptoanaerobacter stomatis TaxID=796937 RepID=UPI003FA13998